MAGPTIEEVRAAKQRLAALFENKAWYRGVGIVPTHGGFGLRLNVSSTDTADVSIPADVDGVQVQVVHIDGYHAR